MESHLMIFHKKKFGKAGRKSWDDRAIHGSG